MRRPALTLLTAAAALLGGTAVATADPAPAGETAVGLVGTDKLVRIDLAEGGKTRGGPRVSGLSGDTGLIGIDYRPFNGSLYGVGNAGGIYVLEARSGAASKVSQLTVPLQGSAFGVDFNPAADRLRILSDTGQNLRHNIDRDVAANVAPQRGATVVDGPLNRAGVVATGVTGAGYTNNDNSTATGTELFDVDTRLDVLTLQSPPNAGGLQDRGPLGVDTSEIAGFDVFSELDQSGATVANTAYAVLTVGGQAGTYRVDLLTGTATSLGALDKQVTDLAVQLDR